VPESEPENVQGTPRLYSDLSRWWPVLSAPEDYAEEAEFYRKAIVSNCPYMPRTLLELGSGGGNNASHLKAHFKMTLVDVAPGMLAVSKALNPGCEHIEGDMRSVRLGRSFDAVFIHDAVMYMTTEADLQRAIETACMHCREGGVVLLAPDYVKETYQPSTKHGGHDRETLGMRYVEWNWDPDPGDTTCVTDFAYLLRDEKGKVRCEYDRHIIGLFPRGVWLHLMSEVGLEPKTIPFEHSEVEPGSCEVFVGLKRS
jgi:hypothetical protein